MLVIDLFFFFVIECLIELVGLRLDLFLLLVGFGIADVIAKPGGKLVNWDQKRSQRIVQVRAARTYSS